MLGIKDFKEIFTTIKDFTSQGFGIFIKNASLLLLGGGGVCALMYAVSGLGSGRIPFDTFQRNLGWYLLALVVWLVLIYLLGSDNSKVKQEELIKKYVKESMRQQDAKAAQNKKKHDQLIQYRMEIGPKISNILKDIIIELDASRTCVVEMHNGTNNLSDIPFLYGDMAYEEIDSDLDYSMDEFKNVNLVKYKFIDNHYADGCWIGTREEIEKEDPRFAYALASYGAEYVASIVLQGAERPLGFLLVFFNSTQNLPSHDEILTILGTAAQKVSLLLDKHE